MPCRPTSSWSGRARPASSFEPCDDSTPGSIATEGGVGGAHRGGVDGLVADLREFQDEFETAQHSHEGTSTERRPDAVSFDYRRAVTLGPVAIGDESEGTQPYAWRVRDVDGDVMIERALADNTGWDTSAVLFSYNPLTPPGPILELDVAFEQAGRPVVVAQRGGDIWLYWFDPTLGMGGEFTFAELGPGRTPRCTLDDPAINSTTSDIMVFYIRDDAGPEAQGAVVYRMQRERYEDEHETPMLGEGTIELPDGGAHTPFTGTGMSGAIEVTMAEDYSPGLLEPPFEHTPGPTLGDFQIAVTGLTRYRTVFEFSEPITQVDLAQFYPLDGNYANMAMFAVVDETQFIGTGGTAFFAAASVSWSETFASLIYAPGFRFLVIESPVIGLFGQTHPGFGPTFGEGTITAFAPVESIELPPIEQMYLEDVIRSRGSRLVVLASVRNLSNGQYALQSLASSLYPYSSPPDALTLSQHEFTEGELVTVIIIIGPPGSDEQQEPDVFALPEDAVFLDHFSLASGELFNNLMLAAPDGSPDIPAGTAPDRVFDILAEAVETNQFSLVSGTLFGNTIAAIAEGATPPVGVDPSMVYRLLLEAIETNQVSLESGVIALIVIVTTPPPEAIETNQVSLESGVIALIVIVTTPPPDAIEMDNFSLQSGTLVIP